MSALVPLRCPTCGGAPPLRAVSAVECPYCQTSVPVPADYLEAAGLREQERAARQKAQPYWSAVSQGVSPFVPVVAMGVVALLPPLAAVAANLLGTWASQGDVMAYVALPLLMPGCAVFVWALVVDETTLGFRAALGARAPKEEGTPMSCRSCGAPLDVEPEALFATCLYCETDSLLEVMPLNRLAESLRSTLSTLQDAAKALRRRRRLLAVGVGGIAALVGSVSAILAFAVRATL